MTIVGLLNPGAMGASVGAAATTNATKVIWASEGRGPETIDRATKAGLEDCQTLAHLFSDADIVLSVCPPQSASAVAAAAADHHFKGLFVDANAIAPQQSVQLSQQVTAAGATFIDGGIIGGPAWQAEAGTKLWLSGDNTSVIENLFAGSPLQTETINHQIGSASALKMAFAAYTKGSTALLMATLAVAENAGVRAQLEQQWGETFTAQTHARLVTNSAKAWRFAGEMEQISETFNTLGLDGFHDSAAQLFSRLNAYKDWQEAPDIEALIASVINKGL